MKLRPHHVLDIIRTFGNDIPFKPHPYGHALHRVAAEILADVDLEIEFILGADEICEPCKHLTVDGQCEDMLHLLENPLSKQEYNDDLDKRLFEYLNFEPGTIMSLRAYLELVNSKMPDIVEICTHPNEDKQFRLNGLINGIKKLRI